MAPRWCIALVVLASLAGVVRAEEPAAASPAPSAKERQTEDEYELQRMLVDTLDQVQRNYVKGISRRELIEAAIDGVLRKLDPYSSYIAPDELERFRGNIESEFGGIGIQITMDRGQLLVLSPLVDTPAYHAGILAGDRIVEIDGRSTKGIDLDQAMTWLKGKIGSQVALAVIHPGRAAPEKVTVVRGRVHLDTVLGDRRDAKDQWDFMLDPEKRIGYVRLTAFSRGTADELRGAIRSLQERKFAGLILDLRFNAGGLLSSAIEVSDLFVDRGRIVSTSGRNVPERVWNARAEGTFSGFPMVVLVNRYSASASEIVAACLQDHRRAVVVGERTWGKGSVQNVIPLENGQSALKLTTASYQRPSGKNIHRFPDASDEDDWGVKPNAGYEVKLSPMDIVALMIDRRDRDIVRPHPTEGKSADALADDNAPDSARDAPAKDGPSPKGKDRQITDRALRKAVDYLSTALVKAEAPPEPAGESR